ncbi:butyrate kinase [Acetohalobium arabaticum]|uniref:Probable butyrate kinase n=1 Tax=Acetohalobium arabaticum (strain ATCC 49924 / DSM 5501 / Z-7288) TaxID=574087 RepID=D9QUT8_ACEAZ|nr:butyrate kinase [Acetohalobium arabaticum]ADL11997.1 butyrate kinase [Acetohalobium arabaticum DSM 5501]
MENIEIIFTVNPGATSTKCALYQLVDNEIDCIAEEAINHPDEEIVEFDSVSDQVDYREELVRQFIDQSLPQQGEIIACAGRGGMLTPVPSGAIKVNDELVDFCLNDPVYYHASNLGAPLAYRVANTYGIEAFIVDPVAVDELTEVARVSGCKDFPRFSFVHALNVRATVRKLAEKLGKDFEDMKCVTAHLGGGFSIAAIDQGRIVDNDNRMEGGPFTPERAGGVPPIPLVEACFSGDYTKEELMKKLYGEGGVYGYLGTKDMREVVKRVEDGDEYATLIYDAMIYQICKEIAAMASVVSFDLDGIVVTGGLAYSDKIIADIKAKVSKLGQVYVYPGSNESEALAATAARVINGEEYREWPVEVSN